MSDRHGLHWSAVSPDPNSKAALGFRRTALETAQTTPGIDRIPFLIDLCRGRRVLDVGCVDHFVGTEVGPTWLHAQLAQVSSSIVGVDLHGPGIANMQRLGFTAVVQDIEGDIGRLRELGPFDVIVAGEVIEHLGRPICLFTASRELLRPTGQLVITTPNPFAPWRARAGQLGIVWENVDHVAYFPPTGVVELADRAGGLRLTEIATEGLNAWYRASAVRGRWQR